MRVHSAVRAGLTGVAVVALAAGCGGGSTKPMALKSATPTVRASSPSTLPTPTPSQQSWSPTQAKIISVYTGFWAALPQASRASTDDERLRLLFPYATTPALPQTIATLNKQHVDGKVLYGIHVPHVVEVTVTGQSAKLVDCQDAHNAGIARSSDGAHLTVGVARNPVAATLLLRGDDWKVSVIDYPEGGSC